MRKVLKALLQAYLMYQVKVRTTGGFNKSSFRR